MEGLQFEWDEKKDSQNQRKHKVSFAEARTIFFDQAALRSFDPEHSVEEDRYLMLGMSFRLRLLLVSHCYRKTDTIIRIISARKANKEERKLYREWRERP